MCKIGLKFRKNFGIITVVTKTCNACFIAYTTKTNNWGNNNCPKKTIAKQHWTIIEKECLAGRNTTQGPLTKSGISLLQYRTSSESLAKYCNWMHQHPSGQPFPH